MIGLVFLSILFWATESRRETEDHRDRNYFPRLASVVLFNLCGSQWPKLRIGTLLSTYPLVKEAANSLPHFDR